MRSVVFFLRVCMILIVLTLFAQPLHAWAGLDVTLEDLTIQLWPDHDQPAVLVIYDFTLESQVELPASMRFTMPSKANLVAVAKNSNDGLVTVDYELLPAHDEDMSVISFTITEQTSYHLEYYLPYTLTGKLRNFVFTWPGDYAVKSFNIALQKPSAATNIVTDPVLTDIRPDQSGFAYQAITSQNLAARETFTLSVRYENPSDRLTASDLSVQPSSPLTENLPGQVSLMAYLPWALGGLAVALIVGGIGWYWFSTRESASSFRPLRRRGLRQKPLEAVVGDRQVYCHQCGKRAQPDDRFCRTCGTELRQGDG